MGYRLGEFEFQTEQAYQEAKKEVEVIAYLRQKTNLGNPNTALQLYEKLIARGTLTTPVGLAFLKELRDSVIRVGLVDEKGVPPLPKLKQEVPIKKTSLEKNKKETISTKEKISAVEQKMLNKYQKRAKTMTLTVVMLTIVIIAFFCIELTGQDSPFQNYEMEVLNKYAGWADDLTQKEQDLYDWETALKQKEQELLDFEKKLQEQIIE